MCDSQGLWHPSIQPLCRRYRITVRLLCFDSIVFQLFHSLCLIESHIDLCCRICNLFLYLMVIFHCLQTSVPRPKMSDFHRHAVFRAGWLAFLISPLLTVHITSFCCIPFDSLHNFLFNRMFIKIFTSAQRVESSPRVGRRNTNPSSLLVRLGRCTSTLHPINSFQS